MENCVTCRASLFSAVHFCPYCGEDRRPEGLSGAAPAAAAAAPAPAAAAAPVHTPAPQPASTPAPEPASTPAPAPASPAPVAPPRPAAPPPAPASDATPFAPATPALRETPRPPRNRKAWIAGVLLLCLAAAVLLRKPAPTEAAACDQAYEAGKRALAQGNESDARAQLERAGAACGAGSAEARDLGARIEAGSGKAQAAAACETQLGDIRAHLDENDLAAARTGLAGLDGDCAAGAGVKPLKARLARQDRAATEAGERAFRLLGQGDGAGASQAIDRLEQADRSHPDIARLRAEVRHLDERPSEIERPAAPDLPDEPVPVAAPRARSAAPVPVPPAVPSVPSVPSVQMQAAQMQAQMEAQMAQGFLRDAERALARGQFDAARTYIDSARRVDPNNKQADALAQSVRERERQVLQNETTIR